MIQEDYNSKIKFKKSDKKRDKKLDKKTEFLNDNWGTLQK